MLDAIHLPRTILAVRPRRRSDVSRPYPAHAELFRSWPGHNRQRAGAPAPRTWFRPRYSPARPVRISFAHRAPADRGRSTRILDGRKRSRPGLVAALLWATLYLATGYISHRFNGPVRLTGYIWLPAGVTVGAFMLRPMREWLTLAGAFLVGSSR